MSCCRRLLFQVHFLNLGPRNLPSRNFRSNAILPNASSTAQPSPPLVLLDRHPKGPPPLRGKRHRTGVSAPETGKNASLEAKVEREPILTGLQVYESLRLVNRRHLSTMDVDWIGLLDEAISSDNATAVSNLVNDLLSTPDSSDRIATVHQYLIRVGTPSLRPEEVVLLLQAIATPSAVRDMPVVAIARLAEWLGKLPDSHPHRSLLSDIIQSLLVSRLKSVKAPSGARLIGYRPPSIAHAAFLLVRSLSSMEHQGSQRALKIFQTLVGKGFIPPEVLYSADRNIKDFDYIVKTALVRASLHWGWTSLAVNLLEELLSFGYSHQSHLINLVVDGLYILLDSPTRSDITAFTNVIRVLHLRIPTAIVPDGLLRQFYAVAHEYDMPYEAESVYALSRSPDIAKSRTYPPPQGPALHWFMAFLTHVSKHEHLSRELVTQVAEDYEPIPPEFRAKFISLVASSGFARPARILWERYSIGKDKDAVLGSSALMLRMVDLFYNLYKRAEVDNNHPNPRMDDASPLLDEGDTSYDRSSASYLDFADRLLAAFVKVHEPLAEAHHFTLTSLARAYFILGRFSEGFEAFKYLLDRKEIPDLYDINVALSALAENRPRAAARMIERMLEKGLRPDAVSFGTVLHHALLHGDKELVSNLVDRARDFNGGRITLESISALIRASLRNDNSDPIERKATLRYTLNILDALKQGGFLLQPSVGKQCVRVSLEADEPMMAYKFWDLLLRHRAEWEDQEQRFLRRWIAKVTRSHRFHDRLGEAQCRVILSQLRENRMVRRSR